MNDRKTVKCKLCDHIHWEDEPHECPTPEYIALRNKLISEAARWDEIKEEFE